MQLYTFCIINTHTGITEIARVPVRQFINIYRQAAESVNMYRLCIIVNKYFHIHDMANLFSIYIFMIVNKYDIVVKKDI